MKRTILISLISILTTVQATAQTVANGYYRIQNNASQRYITIKDNKVGGVDYSSTNVDLSNIETWRGFDYVKSNPASIIYVEQVGTQYNLKAQGTSIYDIAGGRTYLDFLPRDGGTFVMSVTYNGLTGRLYDSTNEDDEGYVNRSGVTEFSLWKFNAIDTESNYIGLQPSVETTDGWYGTVYASYPFKVVSSGVTVYYVNDVKEGVFQLKEITDEVKPAATPLVFKCSSNDPAQNKIMPVTDETTAPTDNQLGGTYFASTTTDHKVFVKYDAETMRVLGKNDAGELIFTSASSTYLTKKKYIPMNTCWLNVPSGLTGDFKLDSGTSGIRTIESNTQPATSQGTYTLTGVKVEKPTQPGIYIQNGKKVVIK